MRSKIRLQPGQEGDRVTASVPRLERTMPILVMQCDVEPFGIDQRGDMQARQRLHKMFGAPFGSTRPQMRANHDGVQPAAHQNPSIQRRTPSASF